MPARNFYRREPVGLGTQISGGRILKIPSGLPIPNLDAIRDIDPETFQALSSLQEGIEMLASHVGSLEGNVGEKPRPPLNPAVALVSFPSPHIYLTWTPDPKSQTPVAYYKVYRATAGDARGVTAPTFDTAVFIFAVVAQDLAYLPSGSSYQVNDVTISTSAFIFPGSPGAFYYWVSSVDRFGRESFPFPCSGSPVTILPNPVSNLNFFPSGKGMNLLYNGKLFGTAAASLTAKTAVTAATNAAPIQITSTAHGLNTGDRCMIRNVGGNYASNGVWFVTKIDANNFTLNGSTGNAAYTSGGSVYNMVGQPNPQGPQDATGTYIKSPWYLVSGTAPKFHAAYPGPGSGIDSLTSNTCVVGQDWTGNSVIANLGNALTAQMYVQMIITPTSVNPGTTGSVGMSLTGATGWASSTWVLTGHALTQNIPNFVVFGISGSAANLGADMTLSITFTAPGADLNITRLMCNVGYEPTPFTEYEEPTYPGFADTAVFNTYSYALSSAAPPF